MYHLTLHFAEDGALGRHIRNSRYKIILYYLFFNKTIYFTIYSLKAISLAPTTKVFSKFGSSVLLQISYQYFSIHLQKDVKQILGCKTKVKT